jgi:chromosome partitioning protein
LALVIIVVAGLKGGVGKTTTSVYLSAVAAGAKGTASLVDADPQASAADWLELADDEVFDRVELVEAPTDRLLLKTLDRVDDDEIVVVDTPPGQERLLGKAIERASAVVIPTRVGGVETPRVEAVLDLVPSKTPVGLVICSARTYTRDYQDMVAAWDEANVSVWGSVSERVNIASGPTTWLSPDGLESYRAVWRRAQREIG